MRILIIGANEIWAIEKLYLKYMKALGVEADIFPAQSIFLQHYQRNIVSKLLYKAGLSSISGKIDKAAREKIDQYQPTVVWVFKGMEIETSLLKWILQKGIKLVNYNPDNPFIFSGKGSGNKNITKGIPFYNLHFTYNLSVEEQLKKQFSAKTAFLPFGFDVRDELYTQCAAQPEINKVCFLGNPDKPRAAFLQELASMGVEIDVYGNDWDNFVQHENIHSFKPVYQDDFWKLLRQYRIQVNLMRIHNEDSHNMRSFEVPGIGGIMIAPDTREHRIFFEDAKEVFLFRDAKHCAELVKHILHLSTAEAMAIRARARQKSVQAGYTYKDRAAFAVGIMNNL